MPRRPRLVSGRSSGLVVALAALAFGACRPGPPEFDLIIRNGLVVDGTGASAVRADVAITGDRIVEIGDLGRRSARDTIDATGRIVAPGFIDTQAQSGRSLLEDGSGQSHVLQGITSEIIGEGSTPALWDEESADRAWLARLGLRFDWQGVDGYLYRAAARGITMNLGTLAPINQLRLDVVGMRNREATSVELAEMQRRLDLAMQQGAFGLSSALIYPPGAFATTDELIALAKTAAAHGGRYVSHIRGEGDRVETALDEAITIGERARIPVVVFHLKIATRDRWHTMPQVVQRIEAARARGVDVSATVYPYPVAGTSLAASLPDWVHEGGESAMLRRIADPVLRARIRREIEHGHDGENFLRAAGFDGVTISSVADGGDTSIVGLSLAAIAERNGRSPWDTFFDVLLQHQGRVQALYALMHEDDVRVALQQPWASFGTDSGAMPADGPLAVGRPHPRGFGTFPRVLGRYVRDEQAIPLPEAIRRMTSFAAAQMGIDERGALRPGWFADVVVFDPATIRDRATFETPRRFPDGVEHVIVNGMVTVRSGALTGARRGRPLLGPGTRARRTS